MSENIEYKSFEEKMASKIQEVIGDMINKDELIPLVEKGIQEAFFESRKYYGYNGQVQLNEPLMIDVVKKHTKPIVEELIKKWLEDNPDSVKEIFDNVVRDGLGTLMFESLNSKFQNDLFNLSNKVQETIGQGRF